MKFKKLGRNVLPTSRIFGRIRGRFTKCETVKPVAEFKLNFPKRDDKLTKPIKMFSFTLYTNFLFILIVRYYPACQMLITKSSRVYVNFSMISSCIRIIF
jgi:hypothetical protein